MKDLDKLRQQARDLGWEVGRTRNGHIYFKSPEGSKIFGPSSPSDRRAIKNLRAQLRRAGLAV